MLKSNWLTLLKKSWTHRILLIAGLLSGAQSTLPLFSDYIAPTYFSLTMFVLVVGAYVTNLLAREEFPNE